MTDPMSFTNDMPERLPQAGGAEPAVDLRRLISDHHARVYRYALHLTGSANDAEDVTQQVFLMAQQRLHQLRDPSKAESWLLSIARTSFLKSVRRKRPVDAASLELNVSEIPAEVAEDTIDRELLGRALAMLSDDYRLVLLMYYFEDASYREIAEQLELPIGTVMSRLSRAKGKLRAVLLEQQGFEVPIAVPDAARPRGPHKSSNPTANRTEASDG
ncbi:MAG: sigma-70 family RNA polymerase sigma factor [Planctomycetales bacterium]|nr:sigma-70 family RNA polymerase sigma factor [Planctomycetales bacterium]